MVPKMETAQRMHVASSNLFKMNELLTLIIGKGFKMGNDIEDICGDTCVPSNLVNANTKIRSDLNQIGGKCRSRTLTNSNLKELIDLYLRTMNYLKIQNKYVLVSKRKTVGRHSNGKRRLKWFYTWTNENILGI